ncbi:MAG: hypothetical protein LC642_08555, partial [Verrucomicrobiaceae bacterium]|nr:hypothetical protein [Verrucomicrobiaceae bacterium]
LILHGGNTRRVMFRALGPSLKSGGVAIPGTLQNPSMELFDGNGTLLRSNDNWPDAPNVGEIVATGLAPPENNESAILLSLGPGNYTAVIRGVNRTTGIALAEAYKLNN